MNRSKAKPAMAAAHVSDPDRLCVLFEALIGLMGQEKLVEFIKAMKDYQSHQDEVHFGREEKP